MPEKPLYDFPGIYINEIVSKDFIRIVIDVTDWDMFEREIEKARKGGTSRFIRHSNGGQDICVEIRNLSRKSYETRRLQG